MNYAIIKMTDTSNGKGIRVSLFVCGCRNHCKGCFNPETWRFDYGEPFTEKEQNKILKRLEEKYIAGLSVLGGDPFEPENAEALTPFLQRVKELNPNKPTWVYTGYTYEYIIQKPKLKKMLKFIDVLVDGRFEEELKDLKLAFRGSSNQRIIHLKDGKAEVI